MAAPPASTKTSLQQRLSARARERWPELAGIDVKFRGEFAYVTGRLKDGDTQPLMRLRYGGSAARWGFAIYLASKDGYQDSVLPTGAFAGAPEDALDTACALYLESGTNRGRHRARGHPPAARGEDGRHARHHAARTLPERVPAAGGGARRQSADLAADADPRRPVNLGIVWQVSTELFGRFRSCDEGFRWLLLRLHR